MEDGPTNIGDVAIVALIDETIQADGIGNTLYEECPPARAVIRNLKTLYEVFHDDPLLDTSVYGAGVLAFRFEYFTISCYLLLRHLRKYYVYLVEVRLCFRYFVYHFYGRIRGTSGATEHVLRFVENRQQNVGAVEIRDQIFRHEFFSFAEEQGLKLLAIDGKREFSEEDRIAIFLRDNGLCQCCLANGKSESEARVTWSQFEADHVLPHSQGGQTILENGQVLCRIHNRSKGATA